MAEADRTIAHAVFDVFAPLDIQMWQPVPRAMKEGAWTGYWSSPLA
jgi:hypothetical protein